MFNEILFFFHTISVAGATLFALRLGKQTLVAMICLYTVLSNLFISKQITLLSFSVVNTDVFAVGSILGLNLLQEFFGRDSVRQAIATNFLIMLTYLVMTHLHLMYLPDAFDVSQVHFEALLTPMPRIILSSLFVYLFVQFVDAWLYAVLKKLLKNNYFVFRNMLSLSLTQLLDTVLFTFAALYGAVHEVWHVILLSYCVKMVVIMCNAPFIRLAQ